MTLGEKIKFARIKKSISQLELSDKAGTHQKNISKYEKDAVIPSATTLKKIADALEVSTDYLLGNENQDSIKDKALLRQFKEVDQLPEDDKSAIMRVISGFVLSSKTKQAFA
jgi:transcriptional regulator with XRE-family HTH domain